MKLLENYSINDLKLKNRIVMAPMCMYQVYNKDGVATSFHKSHYVARAIGQVGLIIVEATGVMNNGRITDHCLGLYNDKQIEPLKEIVDAVHCQGSKIAIQLNHAGRKSETTNLRHIGPSAIKFNKHEINYDEMTKEDINEVIESFKDAAQRANHAGFDALEIHGAHGYLIHQFISPLSNHRSDEYGQDRFLFLKQLISEIKTVWPNEKPILLRISATDYIENGLNVDDWVNFLNENKNLVDCIHVSSGGLVSTKINVYPGYQLPLSKEIKNKTDYITIGVGLINDHELLQASLELGHCDLVASGRELLRNPNLLLDIAKKANRDDLIPFAYKRAYK